MISWPSIGVAPLKSTSQLPELFLTNSARNEKQSVGRKELYRMYVCGITPYDATHLGHAATYLTFDLIQRYLRATGADVHFVQNITDIDDPLLERAERDGVDWKDLAHQQIDLFRSDMTALRVIPPRNYIGAVEAIPLVIEAIAQLKEKQSIYPVDSDLYFSVHKDPHFGERSHLNADQMLAIFSERGGDPQRLGKKDPLDCLVWMSQRPDEPGWESTFGVGRPGWHIECTAIAMEYLRPDSNDSELIDIQGGGSDLIFPHHEMCAAQGQVLSGKPFATSYVHAGMIGLDGEKMSKSKGNLVFVSQLLLAGRDPMAIRWALMKDHYRTDRMWSEDLLVAAEFDVNNLRQAISQPLVAPTSELIELIIGSLADDLDTASVINALNSWSQKTIGGATGGDSEAISVAIDSLLGIKF